MKRSGEKQGIYGESKNWLATLGYFDPEGAGLGRPDDRKERVETKEGAQESGWASKVGNFIESDHTQPNTNQNGTVVMYIIIRRIIIIILS
jgi:hypothetical protein